MGLGRTAESTGRRSYMPALARCSLVAVLVSLAAGAVGQGRADDTAKKELARLEGTWVLVKMEIEGRSLLDKDRPWPKLVIKDGKARFDAKEAETIPLTKVLDLSRKPKTVTVPYEGKVTFYGIYEVVGDELHVCGDGVDTAQEKDPEARRPRKFDSKEGLLLIFKREKK
jgi:uncharacterized protein (TIGR03067 family)